MLTVHKTGSIGALLDEYEKAINELIQVISDLPDSDLSVIIDFDTSDPDCRSIQTVLTHLINSAFAYANYINAHRGNEIRKHEKSIHSNVSTYVAHIEKIIPYNRTIFSDIRDIDLEVFDNDLKMKTHWGQTYDIEQLMEHAIVHILKHRRQIERFKLMLKEQKESK